MYQVQNTAPAGDAYHLATTLSDAPNHVWPGPPTSQQNMITFPACHVHIRRSLAAPPKQRHQHTIATPQHLPETQRRIIGLLAESLPMAFITRHSRSGTSIHTCTNLTLDSLDLVDRAGFEPAAFRILGGHLQTGRSSARATCPVYQAELPAHGPKRTTANV